MGLNICVSCQQPIKHGKGRRITVSMAWIHIECPKKELDKVDFKEENEPIPSDSAAPLETQRANGTAEQGSGDSHGTKASASTPPPETISAIHEGLRWLAAACGGARSLDGQGFNKMDSDFGKKLAAASSLTPRMAVAGLRLVRKYKRQLPSELLERAGLSC